MLRFGILFLLNRAHVGLQRSQGRIDPGLKVLDEALKDGKTHFFGESLDLRSYVWDSASQGWRFEGIVFDNAQRKISARF